MTRKARQAAADGCVLLENRNKTLPLRSGDRVALFGRIAFDYYKSGLGSGGLVNAEYVVSIYDALKAEPSITLDQELLGVYSAWRKENPYDNGQGWGQTPWSQKEMPVTDELVENAAGRCDAALIVIGRTAGEDQDIRCEAGSYLLTETELDLIGKVCKAFPRTAVLLNTGSIIDMQWVADCQVPAVLFVWQGGQEGGNGVCDVLMGRVNPSGRLTDTIAVSAQAYPSSRNFGHPSRNVYQEDIYVGYRFFETFAEQEVLYPFGFGLSYSDFSVSTECADLGLELAVTADVRNVGSVAGRHSVLVYVQAPQGKLGKPSRVLAGFVKSRCLQPGEGETLHLAIPKYRFASYDDSGVTGHRNAYLLEAGDYTVYAGGDVRSAARVCTFRQKELVLEQLREAYAPVEAFDRFRPVMADGLLRLGYENTPTQTVDPQKRRWSHMPPEIPQTGDRGYLLRDVYDGKVSMEDFIAQLSDENLICMFRAEGMCSPKVTPGTAGAFGGVTEHLRKLGIPVACCADGPSGIRMDCGTPAFSLPNGVLLGSTFDIELIEDLFEELGRELRRNRIDTLLGPGLNIHRSPLNGRNFEYCSEDPLLTGLMGAAQLRGMNRTGTTGTIKHFCANNQEFHRHDVNGVISQRALREIYLKPFEYAVREGECRSVMTTYGPVNGLWTAGSCDLNTVILREEWGFDGIVMTDWWAKANWVDQPATEDRRAPMIASQNDLFMVASDVEDMGQDDLMYTLRVGGIRRGEFQRSARNILSFLLNSLAMQYEMGLISEAEMQANQPEENSLAAVKKCYAAINAETGIAVIPTEDWALTRGSNEICSVTLDFRGAYDLSITVQSDLNRLAQLPIAVYLDNQLLTTVSFQGMEGGTEERTIDLGWVWGANHYLRFFFAADGMNVRSICVKRK